MPIFEYQCQHCQHEYELLVRSSESVKCPKCGSEKSDKLFSSVSAHSGKNNGSLPISSGCSPDIPPCSPGCCKL